MALFQTPAKTILEHGAAALALLLAAQPFAQAQDAAPLEKNGVPCVAELCLGDGLAELSKIQWDRAKNPFSKEQKVPYSVTRKMSPYDTDRLNRIYRGDTKPAGAYLADALFDSESLPALKSVNVACERNELFGTFTTKSGLPTRVGIILTPDLADPGQHRWTVINITRTIPGAVSNEQKAEVEQQLSARYHVYDIKNLKLKNPKAGEGRFYATSSPFGFYLTQWRGGMAEGNRMKQHPACGGATKVSID